MATVSDIVQAVVGALGGNPQRGTDAPPVTRESVSAVLSGKVRKAVAHRQNVGIGHVWKYAEEAYTGIDDANRGLFGAGKWIKSPSVDGPMMADKPSAEDDNRSKLFVRLTARYVDAGAAKLQEILIPIDDKAFSLKPTPIPTLIKGRDDLTQIMSTTVPGVGLEREATPEEAARLTGLALGQVPSPRPETWPPRVPLTTKDVVEFELKRADDKAKKAETRLYDWMVETKYPAELRKCIFDAAKLGVGVLKGPFPDKVRSKSLSRIKGQQGPDGQPTRDRVVLQINEELKPACRRISPWNLFPDPSCGEDIHNGDYIVERDFLSPKQLRALKSRKGYDAALIDQIIKEGPGKCRQGEQNPAEEDLNQERYEVFYVYATIARDGLQVVNPDAMASLAEDQDQVYVIATLINDYAVYVTVNPLDSGEFPYHAVPWIRRSGYWAGIGIGEQLITPQKLINGATRALADNAGLSSGIQLLLEQSGIYPADDDWTITPNKLWYLTGKSKFDDARKCLMPITIPNTTGALMEVINYALKLAEESTNIPLISQGQSGATTPDTLGATQLQNNNANQLLRAIGVAFDDYITEPVVRQLYEWLLLDPSVPDEEKGDFQINAHGSAALIERAIQDQTIQQMSELVSKAAAIFGVDPKRWFKEWLLSKRLDPRRFMFSEEEQKKIDERPPTPPPQVQAVLARAEAEAKEKALDRQFDLQIAQLDAQIEERKLQLEAQQTQADTDRDTVYVRAETERTRNEHTARMQELQAKRELAILDYSNKRGISADQVKAQLAQTVMKLRTQEKLSDASLAVDVHKHHVPKAEPPQDRAALTPPTEPAGRAPNGEAWQR